MQDWIEQVQKYNGLPQETIDSLLTIEFEGDQEMYSLDDSDVRPATES